MRGGGRGEREKVQGNQQRRTFLPTPRTAHNQRHAALQSRLAGPHLCITPHDSAFPEEERLPTDDESDGEDPMKKTRRMRGRELKLQVMQGQDILRGVGVRELKDMIRWDRFWDSDVETDAPA